MLLYSMSLTTCSGTTPRLHALLQQLIQKVLCNLSPSTCRPKVYICGVAVRFYFRYAQTFFSSSISLIPLSAWRRLRRPADSSWRACRKKSLQYCWVILNLRESLFRVLCWHGKYFGVGGSEWVPPIKEWKTHVFQLNCNSLPLLNFFRSTVPHSPATYQSILVPPYLSKHSSTQVREATFCCHCGHSCKIKEAIFDIDTGTVLDR